MSILANSEESMTYGIHYILSGSVLLNDKIKKLSSRTEEQSSF